MSVHGRRKGCYAAAVDVQAPAPRRSERFELIAFAVLALAIASAYFYRLGSVPPGLFSDEAADGYSAHAILQTGADEWGTPFPLFFRSFDDYKSPILIYSIVAAEGVFGMNAFAVRLPSTLYAFGMAIAMFFFLRALTGRPKLARWLALLSLLIPAIFTYARIAVSETSCLPFFFVLALHAFLRFESRPTARRAVILGVLFGIITYTYTTSRLLAPLMVATCVLVFIGDAKVRPKLLLVMGAAALVALPMAAFMVIHPHTLDLRFGTLSAWRDHPPARVLADRIFQNYFNHLSFAYLFRTGDLELRHSIGGVGLLPLWLFAPFVCGIWVVFTQRSRPIMRYFLVLLVIAPIPVSLCDGFLHASRTLHMAPLAVVIGAVAVAELLKRTTISIPALALAVAVAAGEGAFFVHRYFTEYPPKAQSHFDEGMGGALQIAFAARQGEEPIYAPAHFFMAKAVFISFFGAIDPERHQKETPDQLGIIHLPERGPVPRGALVILPGAAVGTQGQLLGRSLRVGDGAPLWSVFRTAW